MELKVIREVVTAGRSKIFVSHAASMRKMMMMTTQRGSNRTAVHGSNLPSHDEVNKEKVEEVVSEGKEQREKIRDEVEKKVDSGLKGEGDKNNKGSRVLVDSDSG